ncbi:hypothetical protein ACLESD_25895 [Pyxidicoccus sp. 3LFB2]
MNIRSWVLAAVAGLTFSASAQSAAARQYVDTSSYLTSDADIEAWYQLTSSLKQNFDDVCGDTFCEGDYSNIESLRFRCSVESRTGVIGECVWVFAASNEEIDPATGAITVDTQTWTCKAPLARRTTIRDFLTALAGTSPINAPLPRTTQSLYDGLVDCL